MSGRMFTKDEINAVMAKVGSSTWAQRDWSESTVRRKCWVQGGVFGRSDTKLYAAGILLGVLPDGWTKTPTGYVHTNGSELVFEGRHLVNSPGRWTIHAVRLVDGHADMGYWISEAARKP